MNLRTMLTALVVLVSAAGIAADGQQSTPPPPKTVPPGTTKPQTPVQPAGVVPQEQETHGDWRVVCATPKDQKFCVFSQQLTDSASKQRVLGMELRATAPDRVIVAIVMPFGLAVDKPVRIKVDEGSPMTVPFKTCLQVGCMVTATWEPGFVAALRKGTAIFINATTADTNQDVAFRLSLNGFGSALDRTLVLAKP
ncbi:MAG TPA: invasion associated locus B family protein [Vicinamibacterales bacterium]|jgi:invasion protein IalB